MEATLSTARAGSDTLDGYDGDDITHGGSGMDEIDGGKDDDTIYGEGDDDTLDGGSDEHFSLAGGSGDDTLKNSDYGTVDTFDGGTDVDTIEFVSGYRIKVDLDERLSDDGGRDTKYRETVLLRSRTRPPAAIRRRSSKETTRPTC